MVRAMDGTMVPILDVYETSLDAYGKSHYDCFRRTARITIERHGQRLSTTLGQLLFFRDIIRNGVLEFARVHLAEIKAAMVEQKGRHRQASGKHRPVVQVVQQPITNVPLFSR